VSTVLQFKLEFGIRFLKRRLSSQAVSSRLLHSVNLLKSDSALHLSDTIFPQKLSAVMLNKFNGLHVVYMATLHRNKSRNVEPLMAMVSCTCVVIMMQYVYIFKYFFFYCISSSFIFDAFIKRIKRDFLVEKIKK